MREAPSPETLAWLHQSASLTGSTYSQVLLYLLERVEALEADATEQSQSGSFCNEAIVRRLEALERRPTPGTVDLAFPAPEAAPPVVAIRAALERLVKLRNTDTHALLGSDWHEAFVAACAALAQPPAAQPVSPVAPAGGLVERVALAIGGEGDHPANWTPEARAAIREVAAWMRENEVGYNAVRWLEQEADR
jgi:hypothetical protein